MAGESWDPDMFIFSAGGLLTINSRCLEGLCCNHGPPPNQSQQSLSGQQQTIKQQKEQQKRGQPSKDKQQQQQDGMVAAGTTSMNHQEPVTSSRYAARQLGLVYGMFIPQKLKVRPRSKVGCVLYSALKSANRLGQGSSFAHKCAPST